MDSLEVNVNGEPVRLDGPISIEGLLERCRFTDGPCAVEVNRAVVPKREHATRILRDGDRIEIVTLVGGG